MKVGDIKHKKDGDYKLIEYEEFPRWNNDGKLVNPVTTETWVKVLKEENQK